MTPHDEERFAKLIADFVDGCKFAPPFHLVVIDSRGAVTVTRFGDDGAEQVCAGPGRVTQLRLISPLTVTVISSEGCGRSAKIEITRAGATVQ